ncbi:Cutinase [Gordonia malaquae]|uniref:Uncharacterized protein n=1 Tax=Gordonia malaquae NBRC 108250 TaxID=1223542 RepID=M3THB7_GORML|nr:cutinase family protein [Gordonia malaquae]GAC80861.1 hypothetical protein GM1_023_00200 [Gordonia malaquae NBRC 108250]SEB66261.1 Cutinase [Gordonia malaquae]
MHIDLYRVYGLDRRQTPATLAAQLTAQLNATDPRDALSRRRIDTARAILGDPARRAHYDAALADPAAPTIGEQSLAFIAGRAPAPLAPVPASPRRRLNKKLLVAGIVAVLLASTVVIATATSSSSGSSDCADVIFVGAAGSGQRSEAKVRTHDGMGEFVGDTFENLLNDANDMDKRVEKQTVDYPAAAVSTLATQPQVFLDSITTGVSRATTLITDAADRCPDSTIVAVGYSQGAMVMHRTLQSISPNGSIIGVLIADGDRQPSDPNVIVKGDAKAYTGIAFTDLAISILGNSTATPFASDWRGNLLSWCVSGDTVCSNKPGAIDWGIGPLLHTAGYAPDNWRAFVKQKALG